MGCCLSTDNEQSKLQNQQHFQVGSESLKPNKSPPPSLYQEETVKEVLSETPKPKLPQTPIKKPHQENDLQHQEVNKKERIHIDPAFLDDIKIQENKLKKISKEEVHHHQDQIFEQEESEVCSLSYSESISTTTTNNNDKRDYHDDENEVKQRVSRSPLPPRKRQVSGELGPRKDRVVGKSPTRRTTEQSPSKRNGAMNGGSVRLVQSREMGSGQVGMRRGSRPDQKKRNQGEPSARRSRSPATNRSVMGRSPSTKRANRSPARVRKDPNEGGDNGNMDNGTEAKWPSTNDSTNGTTTNESLENPLVSLECFIFL